MENETNEQKIGFTGTRFGMTPAQRDEFASWIRGIQPTEFHHGDCVGADDEAATIVHQVMGAACKIVSHPPADDRLRAYNPYADESCEPKGYHARNRDIVNATGQIIGAPKESAPETPYHPLPPRRGGTWYTLGYAGERNKAIRILWPGGNSSASFPRPAEVAHA